MDEEKKSQASREEPERVGPYLIQEQVQQSHDSQVELYLATHETSGATALVCKHAAEEVAAPGKDWRVLFGSWASRGYSAMEVEHTDWARALDRQSAESLLLTLEGVLEEVRRMARVVADPHEPRLRWRLVTGARHDRPHAPAPRLTAPLQHPLSVTVASASGSNPSSACRSASTNIRVRSGSSRAWG